MTVLEVMDEYAKGCVDGTTDVCKLVKASCARHLKDREREDIYFDEDAAEVVANFVELMVHVKGNLAGKRITLEPWQIFVVGSVFGWKRKKDGLRRYREASVTVPRKNGKSTFAVAIDLYMLVEDQEAGSEVILAASKEAQAHELFRIAIQMLRLNPGLKKHYGITNTTEVIRQESSGSSFWYVIGKPSDGSNPQMAHIDEFHEHKTSAAYDALKNGFGSRRQPLLLSVSTAGTDISCPYYRYLDYCRKVATGVINDDSLFAVEYSIDREDDWRDFSVWKKANPNYGVSVYEDFLRSQYNRALTSVADRSAILTKNLDVWDNASINWIDMQKWLLCNDYDMKIEDFAGEKCWIGMDLASRVDLASLAIVFKRDSKYYAFSKSYMNSQKVDMPESHNYRVWRDQGWLTVTEGTQTDFAVIEQDLKKLSENYVIQEMAYDPREATYLMQHVKEWASFDCVEVSQSPAHFSETMKVLEAAYLSGTLSHEPDPVLNWAASNVVLKSTLTKLIYPTKSNPDDKIDPVVALIMAISRAELNKEADIGVWSL